MLYELLLMPLNYAGSQSSCLQFIMTKDSTKSGIVIVIVCLKKIEFNIKIYMWLFHEGILYWINSVIKYENRPCIDYFAGIK